MSSLFRARRLSTPQAEPARDDATPEELTPVNAWDNLTEAARELICERSELDIAEDYITLDARHSEVVAELAEARSWARHGYEIGQRHCGWTDHGVAPAWLTEGWPPHIDGCQHQNELAALRPLIDRLLTAQGRMLEHWADASAEPAMACRNAMWAELHAAAHALEDHLTCRLAEDDRAAIAAPAAERAAEQ